MKTYRIESRPPPFDHPLSVTIYDHNGEIEAGYLGFDRTDLKEWAENYIDGNPPPRYSKIPPRGKIHAWHCRYGYPREDCEASSPAHLHHNCGWKVL